MRTAPTDNPAKQAPMGGTRPPMGLRPAAHVSAGLSLSSDSWQRGTAVPVRSERHERGLPGSPRIATLTTARDDHTGRERMCNRYRLALGVILSAGLLAGPAFAQAPAAGATKEINPPIANCNTTPDTVKDSNDQSKLIPKSIDATLLTLGQPCSPKVNGQGLTDSVLDNLQRGFDFYSWLTFIALNSPADDKTIIGQGSRPGGDAMTRWEVLENYRPLADVMLADGGEPQWGKRIAPPEQCKSLDLAGKIVLQLGEAAWNQPFRTGPLIDQSGHYALFDILMNKPMFDYIDTHTLYNVQGQARFDQDIAFPPGDNTVTPQGNGHMGAVMLKVSWRILDPVKDAAVMTKYHIAQALIFFPGPLPNGGGTKTGPTCVEQTLGLVGFHVGHKTTSAPQWVWSSFEQVDNAPSQQDIANEKLHPPYTFYNATCAPSQCPPNHTPSDPWDPPASLTFHSNDRSQVVRTTILPTVVAAEVADLNQKFRVLLKGTVWENYELLATQWPSKADSKTDCNGAPAPTFLANTTLETYSQGVVPLASSSCMACHGNATTQHNPATPSDFTFILEKAQCENRLCPPTAPKLAAKSIKCGFTASAH
jgi:hypothetical protein